MDDWNPTFNTVNDLEILSCINKNESSLFGIEAELKEDCSGLDKSLKMYYKYFKDSSAGLQYLFIFYPDFESEAYFIEDALFADSHLVDDFLRPSLNLSNMLI